MQLIFTKKSKVYAKMGLVMVATVFLCILSWKVVSRYRQKNSPKFNLDSSTINNLQRTDLEKQNSLCLSNDGTDGLNIKNSPCTSTLETTDQNTTNVIENRPGKSTSDSNLKDIPVPTKMDSPEQISNASGNTENFLSEQIVFDDLECFNLLDDNMDFDVPELSVIRKKLDDSTKSLELSGGYIKTATELLTDIKSSKEDK
ncbi:hypothetical protein NEPAR06_2047 [Nematocida parisii]|uniref:Uncharacterized protein n=1 Tax=Nematocida parisii (strain ERTm3) TaxID=935791 RepID=I3EDV4_NEMP3|nr:uncharacterized protein NEPG_00004 [Nematocida parisii ERTm1]EIJ87401.1 hypothetical protein NEQG_02282 [Nematocida parisii ERTm3]KAI5145390.1 hypothetical protein NEPAR07_1650 [Nematocida parisii]EIJ94482.1 hypothetical protein NEPG_00004 [Nematocida parisii ERTm1]KAI5155775.1 hypothetical protein NEPAR06_2047 [Nematocida parisii]KAI5157002.1 hypothetical protein NEPAR05_0957 [Nematocida parisii]|eukprot:XP_013057838.1 hypothetical protein NEPG_00004 [Nematocida parisii ERTm1]